MPNLYTNRLDSFRTTLAYLAKPAHRALWHDQTPVRFTQRVDQAIPAVAALADYYQQQQSIITGYAMDKAREEEELEVAAHTLGTAVTECYRHLGDEASAAKADFTASDWARMRDSVLLATAREVIALARTLLNGTPQIASEAAVCGITAERAAATEKEALDFERIIASPQQAIATRKALTALLRDRFAQVEAIFESLDNLIIQFPHPAFVQGYHASRRITDRGHSPKSEPEDPSPPPAPPQS